MESIRYRTIEMENARVEIGWWQRPGIGLDFEYDVEGPGSSVERNFTARFPLRAFTVHWIRWTPKEPPRFNIDRVFTVHEMVRIPGRGNIAVGVATGDIAARDMLRRDDVWVLVKGVERTFSERVGLNIGGDYEALQFERGQTWKVYPDADKRL